MTRSSGEKYIMKAGFPAVVGQIAATLVILTCSAPLISGQTILTNGLVGYYPFHGNSLDTSGSGNDAVVFGAFLTTNRFGMDAEAYFLNNGAAAYIQTTNHNGFPFANNDFTVSLWVSLSATFASSYEGVFANGSLGQFQLVINPTNLAGVPSGSLGFLTGGTGHDNDCNTAALTWVAKVWYNVQVVRASNTVSIYRDGLLLAQSSTTYGNNASGANLNLTFGSALNKLSGKLDDIRIYNRALSASELQQLYQYESGPWVSLIKAVKPSFNNLNIGANYQLQVSTDLNSWTNYGSSFTATNNNIVYPQYWDVENWNSLYFRLQIVP